MSGDLPTDLRVLLVAEHASLRFGGEAALPLHYFRWLRERGTATWMICHERTREELAGLFPGELDRIRFVADTWMHRLLWQLTRRLPRRLGSATTGYALRLLTQLRARREARRLIAAEGIQVVHQPIPVSPREPSLLYGLGAPVVIGPMNGGMTYPPAFRQLESPLTRQLVGAARIASGWVHWLLPGKRRASTLLVANERTRRSLPGRLRGRVLELVENGVDLAQWRPEARSQERPELAPVRFVFAGRLVDWKAVDVLLEAFRRVADAVDASLEIIGDGPMMGAWRRLADELQLGERVTFAGWLPQAEVAERVRGADVFVLPSVWECGGAVVLEAMAVGLPVVATAWGGPADYLDESCGVLVAPRSREALVAGLAEAMLGLARSPERRAQLGAAARERVRTRYDWRRKVDAIVQVYRDAIREAEAGST